MTNSFFNPKHRVALITGASRGLGLAAAHRLAMADCIVWLGVRNIGASQHLLSDFKGHDEKVFLIELDVTKEKTIANAVQTISHHHKQLDILINNAGVMLDGDWVGNTSATVDLATLKRTFETNFFGAVALTQAMWPLLAQSGHANVVNVSSRMGSNTLHADPNGVLVGTKPFAYNASKSALNAFTTNLAEVGRPLGIQVNSAHPGWVRTELGTDHAALSVDEGVETIVELSLLPPNSRTARFEHAGVPLPW